MTTAWSSTTARATSTSPLPLFLRPRQPPQQCPPILPPTQQYLLRPTQQYPPTPTQQCLLRPTQQYPPTPIQQCLLRLARPYRQPPARLYRVTPPCPPP